MSEYEVFISEEVTEFLLLADEKTERICKNKLAFLTEPRPGHGRGDKEHLPINGKRDRYRLHISRSYTALYTINKEDKNVKVLEITDIDSAHKRYGF